MVKKINVSAFLKELGDDKKGMSKPVLVIGDDNQTYILKNQNVYDDRPQMSRWVQWDSMFLHEILVYNLAKYLDIKIPECVIANVDDQFLKQAPALSFQHHYSPGLHFASKFMDGVENNLMQGYLLLMKMRKQYVKTSWTNFFKRIENIEDVAKIIAMDLLTSNFDRFGNDGNLIIAKENFLRHIYVIDHGHCFFGPNWSIDKKQLFRQAGPSPNYIGFILENYSKANGGKPLSGLGVIFRALDQHINVSDPTNHSFQDVVEKIEKLTPDIIDDWFKEIPDEWYVDKNNQIAFYKHFLMQQKDLVRIIINKMATIGAFDSHTGGELEWKKTGTQ